MKQYRLHMSRKELEDLYSSLGSLMNKYDGFHKVNVNNIQREFSDAYNDNYDNDVFMFVCSASEVKTIQVAIINEDKNGRLKSLEV